MRALATSPAIHETVVVDRRETLSGIVILGLYAPEIARLVRPGQYAMAVPPGGERAATALGVYEARDERISLMLAVVGVRTRELANLQVGAKLDLLAPLGNGFDLEALRDDVALVAGGVGLASMLLPAQHLTASGRRAHLYYGASTAEALVDESKFAELGIGVSVATDDGTRGYHGFVTELLERDGRAHDVLAGCAPNWRSRKPSHAVSERVGAAWWRSIVPARRLRASRRPLALGMGTRMRHRHRSMSTRASARKGRSFGRTSCAGEIGNTSRPAG
jgi:NAD(P)H-flavin reductase